MIVSARRGYHADSDALENRARRYFHAHPQQAMFSLIASVLLAALVVLALALSAR